MVTKIELNKPTFVFVAGGAGTGKSYVSIELVKRIEDSLYIDKDTINNSFLLTYREGDIEDDLSRLKLLGPRIMSMDPYIGKPNETNIKYTTLHCMLGLAKDNLELGKHPFIQGNYTKEIKNNYIPGLLCPFLDENVNVEHKRKILCFYVNDWKVIYDRRMKRNSKREKADTISNDLKTKVLQQVDEQSRLLEKIDKENYDHLKVDGNKTLEENIFNILEYLRK